ncbi:hypothetical protein VHEMI01140 [[Torrubiella] hemipterigena]|uniref:Uncharacterized protein n=1 Tax=[Torrubiella] hemipterigena TaxID=1531966 RepID=A0A0A1T4E2_9HYPO|nr:hypothetical protein VHEMI01140 [[Torrubiella] hemipterigena]
MVNAKFLFAAVAGLASAAPAAEKRTDNGVHVVHSFEDASKLPLVTLTTADKYKGLHYKGFFYVDAGVGGLLLTGIRPHSPNTVVTTGDLQTLVAGSPEINIDGTDTKSFDFESFWFGCSANTAAVAVTGVPQGCTVTVTGYDTDGQVAGVQSFDYVPTGLKDDMTQAVLGDGFCGLSRVEFNTKSALRPVIANLMDDLSFTLYN